MFFVRIFAQRFGRGNYKLRVWRKLGTIYRVNICCQIGEYRPDYKAMRIILPSGVWRQPA